MLIIINYYLLGKEAKTLTEGSNILKGLRDLSERKLSEVTHDGSL